MGVQLELSQHGGNGDRCVWQWDAAGGARDACEEGYWDVMAVSGMEHELAQGGGLEWARRPHTGGT